MIEFGINIRNNIIDNNSKTDILRNNMLNSLYTNHNFFMMSSIRASLLNNMGNSFWISLEENIDNKLTNDLKEGIDKKD